MTVTRYKRVINPARRAKKRRNPRKLSLKQIKAGFGGSRRKANAKRNGAPRKKSPRTRSTSGSGGIGYRVRYSKSGKAVRLKPRKKRSNPAPILLTVGAVNPHRKAKAKGKRKNPVAKSRKRSLAAKKAARTRRRRASAVVNPVRRRRARRSNPHRVARRRMSRRNGTRIYVTRRNSRRQGVARRNPEVLGVSATAILSGLVGVYVTKTATPMIANAVPQFASSPIMVAVLQGAIAWGGGMLLSKWKPEVGKGFAFGGLMQAGGTLLNMIVPGNPVSAASGVSGLGDFVPSSFPVPQNPIQAAAQQRAIAAAAAASPKSGMRGIGAAAAFR